MYGVQLVLHSFPTRRSSDLELMTAMPGIRVKPFIDMRRVSGHLGLAVMVVAISSCAGVEDAVSRTPATTTGGPSTPGPRSEEHTSELQSRLHLVCPRLLEKR